MKPYRAEFDRTRSFGVAAVVALLLLLATPPVAAQEAAAEGEENPDLVQEIVEVEHVDPRALADVLRVFPLRVQPHFDLGLVTLRGTRADVEAAVAAARRLDVPRNPSLGVQVMAHVLRTSRTGDGLGDVPPGLEDVAEQLRNVFGFQRVGLLDTLLVRGADGAAAQVKGVLAGNGSPMAYRFGFNRLSLLDASPGGSRVARLDGLEFVTDPAGGDVRLITDLEVREGQQAVVGKAASGQETGESLIVVVEIRVLD